MTSDICWSNCKAWYICRGQGADFSLIEYNFHDMSKRFYQPFHLCVSIGVRALTLLLSNQRPKTFFDLLKESLGSMCIEHKLVVPPEDLQQLPNKVWQPVLALWGSYQKSQPALNNYLFCPSLIWYGLSCLQSICALGLQFWFCWFFSFQTFSEVFITVRVLKKRWHCVALLVYILFNKKGRLSNAIPL